MQRRLTATIGLILVLAGAGCGNDTTSGTTAKSAATVTQAGGAAAAGKAVDSSTDAAKQSGSKGSGSKGSDSKGSGSKAASASKSSGSTRSGSKSAGSKTKPSAAKTPAASDGGSPATGGTTAAAGGDSADPRLAVVAVVRRYQKDFIDADGRDACSLLTAAAKKQMTSGGRGRTCAESVTRVLAQSLAADIRLIRRTRAGIHVDDVTITGDNATVDIGKGQRLRLARQGGSWLVSDPSP
jgi:hypothetical protein